MSRKLYSTIPSFHQRMEKLVLAVSALSKDDERFEREIMEANAHKLTVNGSRMKIWITSLRAYSRMAGGKKESVFR